MRTFILEKLVRDKVFTSMQELGQVVEYRVLKDDNDFLQALWSKLDEERAELAAPDADIGRESAQIQSVQEQIDLLQHPRPDKVGVFSMRIFVESVKLKDADPWVEYYLKNPHRFPEVKNSNNG